MKNIYLILIMLIFGIVKSQTIIDINDSGLNQPTGYYRKDIHNVLNKFEVTYLYTNGTVSFKNHFSTKNKKRLKILSAEFYTGI